MHRPVGPEHAPDEQDFTHLERPVRQRAFHLQPRHDAGEPATYEAMLADHAGHPESICCHPEPGVVPAEEDSTIVGLVMDLEASTVRIADGRPCEHAFRTLDYAEFFAGRR